MVAAGNNPPGMRERSPGVWEMYVDAGRDPVTGRRRRISRTFRGNRRDAKRARAALVAEVGRGQHSGSRATLDALFREWIAELDRKGRSPNTIVNYSRRYQHDIAPTMGRLPVTDVTTKMLTDLYGEHQRRGLAPSSVRHIHATISSMMTQACRWGWRDSNPAQWAEPPASFNDAPVVPTPDEVIRLIEAARRSRRPEYANLLHVAATTGIRRGELCALRKGRDIDWDRGIVTVSRNIIDINGEPLREAPTKTRRIRRLAIDKRTLSILADQAKVVSRRAEKLEYDVIPDPFVFSDSLDGSQPWRPAAVTRYFGRLRDRTGLGHLSFQSLRRFMETYGQDLGFSLAQVAMRAGHDQTVAARHYIGDIPDSDRSLAEAISRLLDPTS